MNCRPLIALAIIGALWAASMGAEGQEPAVPVPMAGAQEKPPLRFETKWLRVELDPVSGAIVGLAADPSGAGRFTHPLLASRAGAPALQEGGFGIIPGARISDTEIVAAAPGEGFAVSSSGGRGAAVKGLRIGQELGASMDISLASDRPELSVRVTLTTRGAVQAGAPVPQSWAGLLLALDPTLARSCVYFAGRQGQATASPGRLTVAAAPYAGAVCKEGADRCFSCAFAAPTAVEIEVNSAHVTMGIAAARPQSLPAAKERAVVEARLVFGPPRIAALKPVTSKFQPLAQDFILWTTHIATARQFTMPPRESPPAAPESEPAPPQPPQPAAESKRSPPPLPAVTRPWMQETAAVIDPGLPPEIQQAYRRCWLRDVAHGWKSAVLVAGPDLLAAMRDEILAFSSKLNAAGHPPTHIGPDGGAAYGNLDSAGLLIGMIYDYLSRTGDAEFVAALLPNADRMGAAIIGLLGRDDLPVIGEGADTYPDLGFVKGEQTYLAAVCCDGLHKLGRLHESLGETEAAGGWHIAANRIAVAANRITDKGGLWDPERGIYIGWRKPDGVLYRNEDSFANLWAIYSGLCDSGDHIRDIFARLNGNWQRYYLDGLCPTALSIEPYPNGLNQWVAWAGGWDVYLRAKLAEPRAQEVWQLLLADYERTDFPYREASGHEQQEPNVGNRGRIWDSWGFLQAVYAGHYGIEMTPVHLRVLPRPLEHIADDGVTGLAWRGATYDIALRGRGVNLAAFELDGREWASCVLPPGTGHHRVAIVASTGARQAFVMDTAPNVAVLRAQHTDNGLEVEALASSPGRYWFVLQWPQAWAGMEARSYSGILAPQTAPLAGERAAIVLSVPRAGKFSFRLQGAAAARPGVPRR